MFTALALARHLQDQTGMSLKKIITTLKPLQHQTVTIAGHQHHVHDRLTSPASNILTSLGIPAGH